MSKQANPFEQYNHDLTPWQAVSDNIIFTFNMGYIQIITLQNQTPIQQPSIFVFHFTEEHQRLVIRVYQQWSLTSVNIDFKMLQG